MSLTRFMDRPDVRAAMKRDFPKPALPVSGSIRALPCSTRSGLVGTTVDYLLRFFCEHRNPNAITRRLVAEAGRQRMEKFAPSARVLALADEALAAVVGHRAHIRATGTITRESIVNAWSLAQIDTVVRTLRYDESWFSAPAPDDVMDVKQIVALFAEQTWTRAETVCILNPLFRVVPREIATADADLVIDDTLIDVKTSVRLELTRDAFNQLLGYAMLVELGGVVPRDATRPPLRHIAIYFARHGLLAKWRLDDVVDQARFAKFVASAREGAAQDVSAAIARPRRR